MSTNHCHIKILPVLQQLALLVTAFVFMFLMFLALDISQLDFARFDFSQIQQQQQQQIEMRDTARQDFSKESIPPPIAGHTEEEYSSRSKINYFSPDEIKRQALSFGGKKHFFYNKVSKCGSTSTSELLKQLSNLTIFKDPYAVEGRTGYAHIDDAHEMTSKYFQKEKPSMLIVHSPVVNFTRDGLVNPVYLNMLREPYSRFVSWYNFVQAYQPQHIPKDLVFSEMLTFHVMNVRGAVSLDTIDISTYENLNDCVQNNNTICGSFCPNTGDILIEIDSALTYFTYTLIPFEKNESQRVVHCGDAMLNLAKRNIHKYFAVVGYTENYVQFLQVMEAIYPDIFRGVKSKFLAQQSQLIKVNSVESRKEKTYINIPTNSTREILMKRLRYDYELYYFVKARFDQLYKQLIPETQQN